MNIIYCKRTQDPPEPDDGNLTVRQHIKDAKTAQRILLAQGFSLTGVRDVWANDKYFARIREKLP